MWVASITNRLTILTYGTLEFCLMVEYVQKVDDPLFMIYGILVVAFMYTIVIY